MESVYAKGAIPGTDRSIQSQPANRPSLGQGNKSLARQLLTQAIQLGGETIRQDALKDSEIDPTPQDEAFRQLVHSLEATE